MSTEMFDNRVILIAVGLLTIVTNAVVEVLKQILWDKVPTNVLVVIVAETLTLASGFAWAQIAGATVLWYHVIAAVVAGLMVAGSAMFGFDKFKETLKKAGELYVKQS